MNSLSLNSKISFHQIAAKLCIGFVAIAMVSGLQSCSGSKALAKKGAELETAGLYTDAAVFYYNSLLRDQNNVDARIGLSKTGQLVLNDKLDVFSKTYKEGNYKKAVYDYKDAKAYRDKVERMGLKLEAPAYFTDDYEEAKRKYLRNIYEEGNALMAEKRFAEANKLFKEISSLDPNYKDISDLKNVSRNEPIYIEALEYFDNGQYRKAYYELDKVYRSDPNYKDVAILRTESLDKGKYPVAIVPFENATSNRGLEKQVQARVVTELTSVNDPFLKVIERENTEMVLEEQRLNLSAVVDEQTAAEVGNLLGAKAVVTGTVLSYTSVPGKLRSQTKNAYEAYQVKRYNKDLDKTFYETRYKPVSYTEYYNHNEVSISFQYKAISLETGEVLFSKVVDKNAQDNIFYATYDGEPTKLFPASSQGVNTSRRDRQQLQSLIRADRSLKSINDLATDAFTEVSRSLSSDLLSHMNNL